MDPVGLVAPFWTSPDIATTPVGPLVGGSTVTLNVTVHNSTGSTQSNVVVDAYYTDPRTSLEFPNPNGILIGTRHQNLPPGDADHDAMDYPDRAPTVGVSSTGVLGWSSSTTVTCP